MEVETYLAPRDHVFVVDEVLDLLFGCVVVEARVVRMRADRGINALVLSTQFHRPLKRATVRITSPDVENQRHARRLRALNYFLAIDIELLTINMRMRINKHFSLATKRHKMHKMNALTD